MVSDLRVVTDLFWGVVSDIKWSACPFAMCIPGFLLQDIMCGCVVLFDAATLLELVWHFGFHLDWVVNIIIDRAVFSLDLQSNLPKLILTGWCLFDPAREIWTGLYNFQVCFIQGYKRDLQWWERRCDCAGLLWSFSRHFLSLGLESWSAQQIAWTVEPLWNCVTWNCGEYWFVGLWRGLFQWRPNQTTGKLSGWQGG